MGMGTNMPDVRAPKVSRSEAVAPRDLMHLLAWLSPSFPVGAYTYSHGLEWAIEDGSVTTAADLEAWLSDILVHGGGRNDAILLAHAYRAAAADDMSALRDVAGLALAFQPSRERHLETSAQGRAFLKAVVDAWENDRLAIFANALDSETDIAYPVAVGVAAAAHDIPLASTLVATLSAFVANLVSAGVRAIPIGQTDGQRTIAALTAVCEHLADMALHADIDDLGGITLRADIASMNHETQYTRLFRS